MTNNTYRMIGAAIGGVVAGITYKLYLNRRIDKAFDKGYDFRIKEEIDQIKKLESFEQHNQKEEES